MACQLNLQPTAPSTRRSTARQNAPYIGVVKAHCDKCHSGPGRVFGVLTRNSTAVRVPVDAGLCPVVTHTRTHTGQAEGGAR
jgi:hypothetical protein